MRVIFVCSGNTCRSPFAEGYFNNLKLKGISAESRGLTAPGMPVSENSAAIASKYGFDISDHRSTVFNRDDLDADYIFTMSDDIKDLLISFGAAKDKTFTLGNGISDPYGGDITVYGKALRKIADEIDKLVFGGFFDKIRIVEMKKEHIPFIVKTEEDNFSKPWSERSIIEASENNTAFFIALYDEKPAGYIGIYTCIDEGYIGNIAVTDNFRRMGVASRLIDRVISYSREKGLSFISLEVRRSNKNARSLYEIFDFEKEGLRKNYYVDPIEDAIIMTRRF